MQSKIIQTDLKDASGRKRMRTFTPADQVLVYCHNMMPAHYACAKLMYGSVRGWVEERLSSTSLRTISVHLVADQPPMPWLSYRFSATR